jgi:hypothetical protein
LIAAGSLFRAVNLAAAKWPDHANVKHAVATGFEVDILDSDVPSDVVVWTRDWCNLFHGDGAAVTCIQMLEEALPADNDWIVYKDQKYKGLTARAGRGGKQNAGGVAQSQSASSAGVVPAAAPSKPLRALCWDATPDLVVYFLQRPR